MCVCMSIYIYIYIYVCVCVCVCKYIYKVRILGKVEYSRGRISTLTFGSLSTTVAKKKKNK